MIEFGSSIKHWLTRQATSGQTLQVAGEAVENSLTHSKSNPVSKIIV
jgi:hypothetical protein